MARGGFREQARRLRLTPTPEWTGNLPRIAKPATPGPSEAPTPIHPQPKIVEFPRRGVFPPEPLPGQPTPSIPAEPGAPITERQRSPRKRKV